MSRSPDRWPLEWSLSVIGISNRDEYVQLSGLIRVLPPFLLSLPPDVSVSVIYSNHTQKQWANRLIGASYLSRDFCNRAHHLNDSFLFGAISSPSEEITAPLSPPYVTYFDNDDFIAPHRFKVIHQILTTRPEIDLLLAAYHGVIHEPTIEQMADVITSHWATDESYPEIESIKRWTDYNVEAYGALLETMNRGTIRRWRLGSLEYEPVLADVDHQAQSLAEIDNIFLASWPSELSLDLKDDTEREHQWLRLVSDKSIDVPGRTWGVGPTSDGWATLRRQILDIVPPPVAMWYGEDTLYNWRVGVAGFNFKHFVDGFKGGSYVRWPSKADLLKR